MMFVFKLLFIYFY